MDLTAGSRIDRFIVEQPLGAGGMARVYRIQNTRLGSMHALKVLRIPTPSIIERLLQEGRLQSTLRHPNIVSVTDIIDVEGVPGLVMEYIDGPSLSQLLARHRLTLAQVDALAAGLLDGVGAAHRAGLVHRDLKPGNILLQVTHERLIPKITDFGLAKALFGELPGDVHTRTGAMMGSPAYMAPEQSTDAGSVDQRADVFAMGCVLYELVTGQRAFEGADTWELIGRIRAGQFTPPRQLAPDLPVEMEAAILGALVPDPDQRIPDIAALSAAWGSRSLAPGELPWASLLPELERPEPTVSAPETASFGQTMTTGSALFGDFQAPSEVPSSASIVSPTVVPERQRRWLLPVGLGLLGAVGLGAVTLWQSRPEPAGLTIDSVPALQIDATSQRQLEDGWMSCLDGDYTGAIRRLAAVTERVPDEPLPWLVLSYAYLKDDQLALSLEVIREAIRLGGEDNDATGSLLRVVAAQQRTGQLQVPEMGTHLLRWPSDLLGQLMDVDYCYTDGLAHCEASIARLLESAPDATLTHRLIAESWNEMGDEARKKAALLRGLEVVPEDPGMLLMLAVSQLQDEDNQQARESLTRAMQADPRALDPRILRAQLAIIEHDDENLEALRAELTSASQELTTRVRFYLAISETLRGLGRMAAADAELERAMTLEAEEGSPDGLINILTHRLSIAEGHEDWPTFTAISERIAAVASQSPEVSSGHRGRQASYYQANMGRAAVARGDLEAARSALARMDTAEDTPRSARDSLVRELAVADGDLDAVRATKNSYWQEGCIQHAVIGGALLRAGGGEAAVPSLRAILSSGCQLHSAQRAALVLAHVGIAEIAATTGESPEEHIATARSLWPDPDADHPLAQRLAALESR